MPQGTVSNDHKKFITWKGNADRPATFIFVFSIQYFSSCKSTQSLLQCADITINLNCQIHHFLTPLRFFLAFHAFNLLFHKKKQTISTTTSSKTMYNAANTNLIVSSTFDRRYPPNVKPMRVVSSNFLVFGISYPDALMHTDCIVSTTNLQKARKNGKGK